VPLSEQTVLWTATVLEAPLADKLDAAAAAGYDAVSIRFDDVLRARGDGWSDARIRSELAARGLQVFAAESLIGWLPGSRDRTAAFAPTPMHLDAGAALQTAASVGAASLSVLDLAGGALDVERAAHAFGEICDQAADLGLDINLEFLPWSAIPDLSTAWSIVALADRPNAGLLLDSWHFARSNSSLETLSQIPGRLLKAVQLNDAPRAPVGDLRSESHNGRLLPGQGDIDLVAILRTLDRIGTVAPLGVEVASADLRARDAVSVATESMTALRAVLELALPTTPLGRTPSGGRQAHLGHGSCRPFWYLGY
jgi:sugar phosphate isomerase/epimerase